MIPIQLETLRLYNPLLGTPKYTGSSPASLTVDEATYVIPANTLVVPNLQAVHTHPRYWGADSLVWRPQRWILPASRDNPTDIASETLFTPQKGTYFPWSEGIRNCPGKKFAQVEFVATLAALFRAHVTEPVPRLGEGMKKARQRVIGIVKDSSVELLLQMRDLEKAVVRWRRRGE